MFAGLLAVVGGYLTVSAFAANALTLPRRNFSTDIEPTQPVPPFESVTIPARTDGTSIGAWYLPRDGASRAVILVHGKDANRSQEWYGRFTEFASLLRLEGFAVLMIDMRGHGTSGAAHFTFGILERRDVLGAVDWLRERGFAAGRIGVLGVSLGGASTIGAAADDSAIGAVAVDSTFAEFCPVLDQNWESGSGLPAIVKPGVQMMSRPTIGYDVCEARPAREIGRIAPRGVLIMYSVDDKMIPASQPALLIKSAPGAEVWEVSGPSHAQLYRANPAAYLEKVAEFFRRLLR